MKPNYFRRISSTGPETPLQNKFWLLYKCYNVHLQKFKSLQVFPGVRLGKLTTNLNADQLPPLMFSVFLAN